MKGLKILQYIVSVVHLVIQFMYFNQWNSRFSNLGSNVTIDAASTSNANLSISQISFIYLFLALFTLAVYVSISVHLTQLMITSRKNQAEDEAEKDVAAA